MIPSVRYTAKTICCTACFALCFMCMPFAGHAQKFFKNGNIITYNGNRFQMSVPGVDTQYVMDPLTDEEVIKIIHRDPYPLKVNGATIYSDADLSRLAAPSGATSWATGTEVEKTLILGLTAELAPLPDGAYRLDVDNIVVDANGKVIFYTFNGVYKNYNQQQSQEVNHAIETKLAELLKQLTFSPGMLNGKAVTTLYSSHFYTNTITISNHHISVGR